MLEQVVQTAYPIFVKNNFLKQSFFLSLFIMTGMNEDASQISKY